MRYDAIVLGAGIHGLCAAFWLRQRGHQRIAVLEQHAADHDLGSSHGSTRITRSSYHEAQFVRLATAAHRDGWPALERALGRALRIPTPGVFFGPPDGPFGAYLRATLAASDQVEAVPRDIAARRFPLLRFEPDDAVLVDHSAAMLLAAATMAGLREWLLAAGGELHYQTPVVALRPTPDAIEVVAADRTWHGRGVVLAAGAGTARLLPTAVPRLRVLHQQVGYFDVDAAPDTLAAGAFPVWARIGRTQNDFEYGLPAFDGAGLKAALHRTDGPDEAHQALPPIDAPALLALANRRFARPVRALQRTERCRYTLTDDQGFVVAPAPHDPRLVVVAACSGHGFKFGPEIGRQAADLLPS